MKMKKSFSAIIAVMAFAALFVSCRQGELTPYTDGTELWPAYSNGKYGYINKKGTFVIPARYDNASSFSCGYANVELNGVKMFINKKGEIQNTPLFDYTYGFWNDYALVKLDGYYGLMNNKFEYTIQPYYRKLGFVSNGLLPAQVSYGDKYSYITTGGDNKIATFYDYADMFVGNYALVVVGNSMGIINKSGDFVIQLTNDELYPLGNNRFLSYSFDTKTCRMLDENGRLVGNALYDFIGTYSSRFFDWKLIPVYQDGRVGYIDKNGNVKIAIQYDWANNFNEGYAVVGLNDKTMVIDEKGDVVFLLAEDEEAWTDAWANAWIEDLSGEAYVHNGLLLTEKFERDPIFSYNYSYSYYYRDVKNDGKVVYSWTKKTPYRRPAAKKARNANFINDKQSINNLRNPLIYCLGEKEPPVEP